MLIINPAKLAPFRTENRQWQGIPGIERTKGGRLFATFYSGAAEEDNGNFCVLLQSDDDGKTWTEPIAAAFIGENGRCYDPGLWTDPLGRLWFFWNAYPDFRVWAAICENPDAETLSWLPERKIGKEVMMNKPTVLSDGSWLFPAAVWSTARHAGKMVPSAESDRGAFVYRTTDQGETFQRLGGVEMPDRSYDEHMVIEKNDKSLWMLVRTRYGIGESFSQDGGLTWSAGENSGIPGPCSRFFIRRLASGRLLLLNHHNFTGRSNMTAMLSEDEGQTWKGFLLLDGRNEVSYPDAIETENGFLYAIYDRERYGAKEILMAKFTEDDILAGKLQNPQSRLQVIVSKA